MAFYVKEYDAALWRRAEERALAMPIYVGSHRGKAANQVGALGEVLFEHLLEQHGIPFVQKYETTEDLEVFGDTIDVKTKDRTVRPELGYDCTVPLYNHEHQRPSRYVFASLLRARGDERESIGRFTKAYLIGWCTLERMETGKVWEADEVDPSNGTRFWTACKNLYLSDLSPMNEMLEDYKGRLGR